LLRGDVLDERPRFETMKAELAERERDDRRDAARRKPAAVPSLVDPIADVGTLERSADEVHEPAAR